MVMVTATSGAGVVGIITVGAEATATIMVGDIIAIGGYINGLTFDGATKDPMQQAVRDALIAFMAATAQANAEAIKEAQRASQATRGINSRPCATCYVGRRVSARSRRQRA
jgi:hypothetical protein